MPTANPMPTTEPTSALTREEQIRHAIRDNLPTEPHQALARPQVRKMLEKLGFSGKKNEVSSDEARAHLLALTREKQINRTADGKYHGIEPSRRPPVLAQNAEPIRRGDRRPTATPVLSEYQTWREAAP